MSDSNVSQQHHHFMTWCLHPQCCHLMVNISPCNVCHWHFCLQHLPTKARSPPLRHDVSWSRHLPPEAWNLTTLGNAYLHNIAISLHVTISPSAVYLPPVRRKVSWFIISPTKLQSKARPDKYLSAAHASRSNISLLQWCTHPTHTQNFFPLLSPSMKSPLPSCTGVSYCNPPCLDYTAILYYNLWCQSLLAPSLPALSPWYLKKFKKCWSWHGKTSKIPQ